jgi:hypothetical protein
MNLTKYVLLILLAVSIFSCATTSSTLGSSQQGSEFTADYDRVYSESLNAVALLSWEITHSEKDAGIIQAKTPMSLWTYGDKITIRLTNLNNGKVRVDVSSGTNQAVDWGKNDANISNFYSKLNALLR